MKQSVAGGFTLIELMITLLIAAIVLSASLPQLGLIANQINFSSIQQSLISSIVFTRGEAIRNGGQAAICASDSIESATTSCSASAGDWSSGWIIFVDRNNNGIFDPPFNHSTGAAARLPTDDEMLKMRHVESLAVITWSQNNAITFQGDGTVPAVNAGTFKFCDSRGDTSVVKGVVLNLSGRVRSTDSVTCP